MALSKKQQQIDWFQALKPRNVTTPQIQTKCWCYYLLLHKRVSSPLSPSVAAIICCNVCKSLAKIYCLILVISNGEQHGYLTARITWGLPRCRVPEPLRSDSWARSIWTNPLQAETLEGRRSNQLEERVAALWGYNWCTHLVSSDHFPVVITVPFVSILGDTPPSIVDLR